MQHVTQKADTGDCGVAAIAMLCGVSCDRVMESVPPDVIPHGLWIPELQHAIEKITGKATTITFHNENTIQQLSRYELKKEPAILAVFRLEAGNAFHYVATDGEYFYDPLLPTKIELLQARTDYHSGWAVLAKITLAT